MKILRKYCDFYIFNFYANLSDLKKFMEKKKEDFLSDELLSNVIAVSEKAGKAIMDIYSQHDSGITYKNDNSPLTLADMAAHKLILDQLKMITPQIPALSEESKNISYDERKTWKTFWLVDPLDGTKEFIKGNGEFTVNIALIDRGAVILGVVHAPALEITYFAAKGKGAFKKVNNGGMKTFDIHVLDYQSQSEKLKIVCSRSHGSEMLERLLKNIGNADYVSMGSSLKLCLIAEGKAHLYPRLGPTMEWDTAAAQCIVESAGGAITDLNKNALRYNKPNLLNPYFMAYGAPSFPWWRFMNNINDKEEKQ